MSDNSAFRQVACRKNVCDADPEDARLADYAMLLYGQALLAEGGHLEDPATFSRRLSELMLTAL
jgi:HSP90 family molecular chaperone